MAITDFREDFSSRYQDILSKSLVAMKIANTRLKSGLKAGDVVHRFSLDLSSVLVRDITNLTDRTIDSVTDTDQTLTVDQKKGTTFPIAHWEEVQAGELNPGMTAGKQVALKVAVYVDASVLSEAQNAFADFDTGNLTTTASTGTPITLSTTNVPQMLAQAHARLKSNNAPMTNMCWVVDPYVASIIAQHPIGKDTQLGDVTFKNGYSGLVYGAQLFVSNNLTGEAVVSIATNPTAGDTITVNGVTFTFQATLSSAGDLHIGTTVDDTRANMAVAFNDIGTAIAEAATTGYTPVSAADQATWNALRITATDSASADTLTIVAIGSGRLTVAETFTDTTDAWTKNFIHCYYGQKGAIDVVIQDEVKMKMLQEPKQDTMNILNDVLYGVKTFTDGSQYFLDVMITA